MAERSDEELRDHLNKCMKFAREAQEIGEKSIKISEFWEITERIMRFENKNVSDSVVVAMKDMFFEGVAACLNIHINSRKKGSPELMAFIVGMLMEDVREYINKRKSEV